MEEKSKLNEWIGNYDKIKKQTEKLDGLKQEKKEINKLFKEYGLTPELLKRMHENAKAFQELVKESEQLVKETEIVKDELNNELEQDSSK